MSALRSAGLGTVSAFASTASASAQRAMLQQLANQRMLQQQQLLAQQDMLQEQANQQPALTRSEKIQQAHEQRLAGRHARAAAIAERREAAKARTLVRSQVKTPQDATQLALDGAN
jgi:hypothetical protein